jgi:hypothetical protein
MMMPKQHRDAMASRIQQRFWYARGRWNTTKRIGQRLLAGGLDVQSPSNLIVALSSDAVVHQFTMWFRRLLPRGVEAPCARSLINAFGIHAFGYQCADRAYADSDRLIELAEAFALSMDACLRDPPASFDSVLLEAMEAYLPAYCDWVTANEPNVREALIRITASRALQLISRRTQRDADAGHERCAKLSIFFGGVHRVKHFLGSLREVQLILGLKSSPFWGPGDTSVFRMMHEALMDEALSRDTVCVKFRAHYAQIPPSKVGRFLQDLRAVLLFPMRDSAAIVDMARALDYDADAFELESFAHRVVLAITRVAPTASQPHLAGAWSRGRDALEVLREAAVDLRHAFALEELERCRLHVLRHGHGFHHTPADGVLGRSTVTRLTESWVERAVQGLDRPQLERLAAGDSFALLRFHDHEIVRFVLEARFDVPLLVPEVLQFDIDRMRAIVCDGLAPERVLHMVDTHEVPDALPQYRRDSVETLWKIVFVCRFQHGDCIAAMAQRAAVRMLLAV